MALSGLHTTNWSKGSYKEDRDFVLKVAENNKLRKGEDISGLRPHFDNKNSIAIGYGFDLLTHNNAQINIYITALWAGALTNQDATLLDQARAQRNALTDAQKKNPPQSYKDNLANIASQLTLDLGLEPIAAELLRLVVDNEYDPIVTNRLAAYGMTLPDSKERTVLVSLTYQSSTYLGKGLMTAMQNDDRAEAWYEIRYNSNTEPANIAAGVAKRRYYEADLFGLYDDGVTNTATMNDANAKGAFRVYTRHKAQIDTYDARPGFSAEITAANTDFETNIVQTLPAWQQPARVYLVTQYGQGISITGDIQVGEDTTTLYFKKTDNDVLTGTPNNDLIFGDSGMDVIQGGLGQDVLYGGQGVDIYRYRPGDGADIIVDNVSGPNTGDGRGAILYDPDGTPQILAVGTRQAQSDGSYTGPWQSPDNTITYALNGAELTITTPGGVFGVKNFNQANTDLNIRLIDLPLEPPANLAPGPNQGTPYNDRSGLTAPDGTLLYSLQGTPAPETIHGLAGGDDIFGNNGGDRLYGDEGDDRIIAGNDSANAYLDGGTGRDVLLGANGRDHLIGGPNDTGDTDDALYGGAGEDYLEGGGGNDVLTGGAGRDLLQGGAGDDYLFGSATARALDRSWSLTPTVSQILAGRQLVGNVWTLPDYVPVGFTGSFSVADGVGDILFGEAGSDYLNGGTGADYLDGGPGPEPDILYGHAGDDVLLGGGGDDYLSAGNGNDVVLAGDGNDLLFGDRQDNTGGVAGNDYLDGGAGDDEISGHGGDNILIGAAGRDKLYAETGNDTYVFNPGDGQDRLTDDAGADTIVFGPAIDLNTARLSLTAAGLATTHSLRYGTQGDTLVLASGLGSIENYQFAAGPFTVAELIKRQGGLPLTGTDPVFNFLEGSAYQDLITGSTGADTLYGGGGNDTLTGGAGKDDLQGGAGDDTYLFNPGDGRDRLVDAEGINTIRFGAGITPDDVWFAMQYHYSEQQVLEIGYGNRGDALRVTDGLNTVDFVEFAAGERFTLTDLVNRNYPAPPNLVPSVAPAAEISPYLPGQSNLTLDTYSSGPGKLLGGDGDDVFKDSADDGGNYTFWELIDEWNQNIRAPSPFLLMKQTA